MNCRVGILSAYFALVSCSVSEELEVIDVEGRWGMTEEYEVPDGRELVWRRAKVIYSSDFTGAGYDYVGASTRKQEEWCEQIYLIVNGVVADIRRKGNACLIGGS